MTCSLAERLTLGALLKASIKARRNALSSEWSFLHIRSEDHDPGGMLLADTSSMTAIFFPQEPQLAKAFASRTQKGVGLRLNLWD